MLSVIESSSKLAKLLVRNKTGIHILRGNKLWSILLQFVANIVDDFAETLFIVLLFIKVVLFNISLNHRTARDLQGLGIKNLIKVVDQLVGKDLLCLVLNVKIA